MEISKTNKKLDYLQEEVWLDKNMVLINPETKDNIILLNNNLVKVYLNEFYQEVMSKLHKDQIVNIQLKFQFEEGHYASFKQRKSNNNKEDFDSLIEYNCDLLGYKNEEYLIKPIQRFIISYHIYSLKNSLKYKQYYVEGMTLKNSKPANVFNKFLGFNFPENMNYRSWGTVITETNKFLLIRTEDNLDYYIFLHKNFNEIDVRRNENSILKFRDHFTTSKNFTRFVDDYSQEYVYKNNKLVVKLLHIKTSPLTQIKKHKKLLNNKIMTLDIETRVENNIHVPYCIGFYDGNIMKSFYITDYLDHNEMIKDLIKFICKPKYSGNTIYVHNLSKFDGILLFNKLITTKIDQIKTKLSTTMRDSKMIQLKLLFSNKKSEVLKHNITFRDFLLILPLSLKDLAKNFNVFGLKGLFPYSFLNDSINNNVDLNYKGEVPNKFYFNSNLEQVEYNNYIKEYDLKLWSLREETIKYCNNDCLILHEILQKFNQFIFEKFKINIINFPTLPSLAFAIFRSKYFYIRPRRFELLQISHQEIILPLNHSLYIYI